MSLSAADKDKTVVAQALRDFSARNQNWDNGTYFHQRQELDGCHLPHLLEIQNSTTAAQAGLQGMEHETHPLARQKRIDGVVTTWSA